MTELGCIGLTRSGRLCIESSDLVIVLAVDLSADSHLSNGGVVLVVPRHEALEAWVADHLVELLGVGRSDASHGSDGES